MCLVCGYRARIFTYICESQTWITQIYASNGLKLTTDLSTWQFNFTKQDRKREKNPFFFFILVVRSSTFFTDCHRHHSDIISSRNNSSVQAKCKQENKTAMHRKKNFTQNSPPLCRGFYVYLIFECWTRHTIVFVPE